MARTPFDLTFEDLVDAGAKASRSAADQAKAADVPLAAFEAEPASPPTWDEARVDLLRKLWADGLSASQIAMRLGGVTRNNIIGKVHRLGLSEKRPARKAEAPVRKVESAVGTATVMTLGAHMCKWPIGDPSSREFTFCGRSASEGIYCVEHARFAYQPPARTSAAIDETGIKSVLSALLVVEEVEIEVRRQLG